MRGKFLLLATFICSLMPIYAEDVPTHLVITFIDDSQVTIPIDNHPVILPGEGTLGFEVDDMVTEYATEIVSKFSLENLEIVTSLRDVETDERNVKFINPTVVFSGFPKGAVLTMSSVDGTVSFVRTFDHAGRMELDLSAYPKGVYIIDAMDKNIKLLVK